MARERKKSEFGKYLAQLIKDAGMTQCDFYSEAEIARPYFYDMLSGRTNPPPRETLERILLLRFGLSTTKVLSENGDMHISQSERYMTI